ncbi:hypothetical protein TWF751_008261 [Orbilia oligospora]|nr:hypothetical protein TWF751_008261 [Orbilia oligospora]
MRSSCPYPIPRFGRQSHNRVQGVLVTTPNKANILTSPFDTKCFDASVSARPYKNSIIQPSTGVKTVWTAVAIKAAGISEIFSRRQKIVTCIKAAIGIQATDPSNSRKTAEKKTLTYHQEQLPPINISNHFQCAIFLYSTSRNYLC